MTAIDRILPATAICRQVVRTRYPNCRVMYRDHPKNRFRVVSGDRDGKPSIALVKGWAYTEDAAWLRAYSYVTSFRA